MKITDKINAYNVDCMDFMKDKPDDYYELALVDPPYGVLSKLGDRLDKYGKNHKNWDKKIPDDKYFEELFRVSKNQIIWGGNYFPYLWKKGCKGFIFWYKHQPVDNWAKGELAWTSFNKPAKCFDFMCYANINQNANRLHPTEKPIQLYKWLLDKYAKKGDKILDTHGGSMSIGISCHDYDFELDICELDKDYFKKATERLKNHVAQQKLF